MDDEKDLLLASTVSAKLNQRSELAQEIISHKPSFLERWALLIFVFIMASILAATWFIKYPDIIETNAVLVAQDGPKEIIVQENGHLVALFVKNTQYVKRGEILGWIESTASHKEVIMLKDQIDSSLNSLKINQLSKAAQIFSRRFVNLGEIQTSYQQFNLACQLFNDYMINGFYAKKKTQLRNDVTSLDTSKQIIHTQKSLSEQDIKLAEESYRMNKILLDQKILTKEEFRSQTSKFLNKQIIIPQYDNNLINNEMQKRTKLEEIDQLDHDIAQQRIIFEQTLQSLKSKVDDWLLRHVLKAPVSGKVAFIIPLQENKYLSNGELLGYINPVRSKYYAEAVLAQRNFGKLSPGLSVQLRFDAYPYQEIGFVEGKLEYISEVPSDSGFMATIGLNHGLITNNHYPIPYKNGLKAQAIIITKDARLFQRLYYGLVKSTSVGSK